MANTVLGSALEKVKDDRADELTLEELQALVLEKVKNNEW